MTDAWYRHRGLRRATGTCACRLKSIVPRVPAACALLSEFAEPAGIPERTGLRQRECCSRMPESVTGPRPGCRGFTRELLAAVPLCARLNGHPVVPGLGLPVPTPDRVPPAVGWPSSPRPQASSRLRYGLPSRRPLPDRPGRSVSTAGTAAVLMRM